MFLPSSLFLRLVTAASLGWLAATIPLPGRAQDASAPAVTTRTSSGDVFAAGGNVMVRETVRGDLIASGGSVEVDAQIDGDAVVAGGRVRLAGSVGHSVYAMGGQLALHGKVGRNARVAGGEVELARGGEIAGNVSIAGGQLRLDGAVRGEVQAAGGRVRIDGPIGGDVIATMGRVELGPNARIAGTLRYRSREDLLQDPAAQVAGGIEKLVPGPGPGAIAERGMRAASGIGWFWTLGLMLLAAAVVAALPGLSSRLAQTVRERPGLSVLLGFVLLVCVPVAALLLVITIIGIPLALFAVLAYFALLPVAYVSSAIGLGDWALQRWRAARRDDRPWRIGAAALAVLALAVLGAIPFVGWLVAFAALLVGLGAMALQLGRRGQAPEASGG